MVQRKIPMRTCVVTKEKLPKKELIRVVIFNGEVSVDESGKKNGKGCYLKKDKNVIETAKEKKILDRVLETKIDDRIFDELLKIVE